MELSKSQKKIAKALMNEALQRECAKLLHEVEELLPQEGKTPHERYLDMFSKIRNFDKYIERQYDGISGSYYFITILNLYCANVLTEDDIHLFDEDIYQTLIQMKQIRDQL